MKGWDAVRNESKRSGKSLHVLHVLDTLLRLRLGQEALMLTARRRSAVCRSGENGSNGPKWKDVSEEGK